MKMAMRPGSASSGGGKLSLVALVSLGFFFGFLFALSLDQEDSAAAQRRAIEGERVKIVAEPVCPPCAEQCEKVSAEAKESSLQPSANVSNGVHRDYASGANGYRSGWVCRSPTIVDKLPQTFIHKTTDFHFRRLVGTPDQDVENSPKNLLALAVGIKQNMSVDSIVKKFPKEHFQIILFHYDNVVDQWNQFEWNDHVIHIQSTAQSKWWFAKRFLHPNVVATYEYIFIWDEDLGVENFDPMKYIEIMKRHELQISQPAIDGPSSWPITIRRSWTGEEVHKHTVWEGISDNCTLSRITPPCAGFVEIQAPVFINEAWKCVWHLIQNDLTTGWGLDFQLQACIDGPPHEHIGIVDTQWIVHNKIPSFGSQGLKSIIHNNCEEKS